MGHLAARGFKSELTIGAFHAPRADGVDGGRAWSKRQHVALRVPDSRMLGDASGLTHTSSVSSAGICVGGHSRTGTRAKACPLKPRGFSPCGSSLRIRIVPVPNCPTIAASAVIPLRMPRMMPSAVTHASYETCAMAERWCVLTVYAARQRSRSRYLLRPSVACASSIQFDFVPPSFGSIYLPFRFSGFASPALFFFALKSFCTSSASTFEFR